MNSVELMEHLDAKIRADRHSVEDFWKTYNLMRGMWSPASYIIADLVGVSRRHIKPPYSLTKAANVVAQRALNKLHPKAIEVSFNMMYPNIMADLYGHVVVNDCRLGDIIDSLFVLRQRYKKEGEDVLQSKAKAVICSMFGVFTGYPPCGDLQRIAIEVPEAAVHLMNELHMKLKRFGFLPIYADTDHMFVLAGDHNNPSGTMSTALDEFNNCHGTHIVHENINQLVITRMKRYTHGSNMVRGYPLLNLDRLTKCGQGVSTRQAILEDMASEFNTAMRACNAN